MVSPVITPSQILDTYRKSDAVLIVCQNNTAKAIEITAINEEAARLLGYGNDEIAGKPLDHILPERIASTVTEFVEYDDDSHDLLAVLGKVRDFSVKSSTGQELHFKLRVIRGESLNNNPWFHLVLVDEEKLRKSATFREMLVQNFKGHEVLNDSTGLPNRLSLIKDLELVVYHVRDKDISASFAILDINHYDNLLKDYGAETCLKLHKHIGQICRQKLRTEDTIGTLSERSLGIIMIDAGQEPARMVLNRLRWAIGVTPLELGGRKGDLVAQVNVSFAPIDGRIRETEILEKCEAFMVEQRGKVNNNVQLVVTHERRDGPKAERRKANIPVAVDRRRRERRKGE